MIRSGLILMPPASDPAATGTCEYLISADYRSLHNLHALQQARERYDERTPIASLTIAAHADLMIEIALQLL